MKFWRWMVLSCALGILSIPATLARGATLASQSIGAYGDSMTMQYSFWLPLAPQFNYTIFYNGTQFNWVDQLVKAGYNFGPLLSPPFDGYTANTYDAGIAGALSADVVNIEVNTLQPIVSAGNLHVLVDIIGANDFTHGEYQTIYNNAASKSYNPLTDPNVISFENTLIANITAGVNDTLAEDPNQKMILATIPDMGVTPEYKTGGPNAAQRAAVTEVIEAVNAQIISLAAQHHFPVLDMFALANATQTLTSFAGLTMLDSGGTSGNDMFLSDGFHPGTVLQGVMANAILQADHVAYGDSITPISEEQIAKWAGLTPDKLTTFYNVAPFVIYNAPEPSTWVLAALGALGVSWAARGRRKSAMARS